MSNVKNKTTETKNAKTTDVIAEKSLTIADVARELKLDPKRARAFMRRNVALYTMRKLKFTKTSKPYADALAALTTYANSLKPIAE